MPPTIGDWIALSAFLIPLFEMLAGLNGYLYALKRFRLAPDKFTELIIQITTVGKEPEMVQKSIDEIHGYGLSMPYRIWVCIEPDMFTDYRDVDRVIVVPKDFVCKPVDKARALEYSRRVRVELGLNRPDIKLLLMDDDSLCSRRYIEKAFAANYDICQGITLPNRWYAMGTWKHVILSHLDDARARNCMIYCSTTQGMFGHPIFVHGEGLVCTGQAEDIVTWDFPIVGSDDLVFGTQAADKGLSWGYFPEYIQIVSPWSFKEHLNQRWRWTWGNIDAIMNRQAMALVHAATKTLKYVAGFAAVLGSLTGVYLMLSGKVEVPRWALILFLTSLACWVFSYAFPAWLCSGGPVNRELRPNPWHYWSFRVGQTLLAIVMLPITAFTPVFVIIFSVLRGRPKKFVMIRKHNKVMNL